MNVPEKLPEKTPRVWLRYAQGDLGVAEREMTSETPAFHTICFLCQGAAEKCLKGYLIAQGWPLKKTHDVIDLIRDCMAYDSTFEALIPYGGILNAYITAGRYPGEVPFEEIGPDQAREALVAARGIRDAVLARLPAQITQEK